MSFALTAVELEGDWSGFLSSLPHWSQAADGGWTGAGAVLRDHRPPGGFRVTIAATHPIAHTWPAGLLINDAGYRIETGAIPTTVTLDSDTGAPRLNHVAVDLDGRSEKMLKFFRRDWISIFLPREKRFDPSVNEDIEAQHLVSEDQLYLTARFRPQPGRHEILSHVGWQCASKEDVDMIGEAITRLGWPIVYGPAVVDGSHLVHFRGPDGRIYDVFYILPQVANG